MTLLTKIPKRRKWQNEITPDFVHIMADGKIIKTGSKELAIELEESGYDFIDKTTKEKEIVK